MFMPQHNNFIEKIINVETGEESTRPYSENEKFQVDKYLQEAQERNQLAAAKKLAKLALLERLGITEDEAKLLLS